MRRHRVALIAATLATFGAAVGIPLAADSSAQQQPQEATTVWKSPSPVPVVPSDQQIRMQLHAQFVSYTTTVLHNEEAALRTLAAAQQAAEATAAARAAQEASTRTAPSTATTYQPTPSAPGQDQLLADAPAYVVNAFHCIAYGHESGGDPTAINPSSGDSGLYQFNVNTWLANGGGQFAPQAYEAPVWAQDTVAYWTWQHDGFSPWNGDNSCWE